MSTGSPPRQLAEAYFAAWTDGRLDDLRRILAPDVTFRGALGTADGVDECIAGLTGMSRITSSIDVRVRVADDVDVITWFDLVTNDGARIPVANWQHVAAGRIATINVTFDPRPIVDAR